VPRSPRFNAASCGGGGEVKIDDLPIRVTTMTP
jgi:hypothetical protein